MEIYLESLLKVGVLVGVEYYSPDPNHDYKEFIMSLLIVRLVFIWK